tara:strand:- start:1961 stop:3412 length:1452 start_codon:yes stop_codon:yes gene_type:complete
MLGSIRKFSKTFMAKIFIAIIALPFILWGMGDIFSSGKQNIIAEINDETISSKEFISYIQKIELSKEQVENFGKSQILENILSNYLSEKIIEIESKKKGIILTDKALKNIIISDKSFQKDKKFLRVEYEKFLIKNGYSAPTYEKYIRGLEIKAQLLNLYSGGIKLPKFIIEDLFNKDNHLKKINYLNLSSIYSKKVISEQEIEKFYNENKDLFKEKFISFKYLELTPEILTKNKNYNDLFYEKIDLIENQILDGKKFDEITFENKNNVKKVKMVNIRKTKKDGSSIKDLNDDLFNKIFTISEKNIPQFLNLKNNFYIIEVTDQQNILLTLKDENLKNTIKAQIEIMYKITENKKIIDLIKNREFTKTNMTKLATENNLEIKVANINGVNDDKILSKEVVQKIYNHSENDIFLITDSILKKNYIVNIEKDIQPNSIDKDSIEKYMNKANSDYVSSIYKSYDKFVNTKYKININEKVLERLKNSF